MKIGHYKSDSLESYVIFEFIVLLIDYHTVNNSIFSKLNRYFFKSKALYFLREIHQVMLWESNQKKGNL